MMTIARLFVTVLLLVCIAAPACEKNETVCEPSTQLFVERFRQGAFPSESYSRCQDAVLSETDPSNNYGSSFQVIVGNYPAFHYHTVIRFEIAGMLPASAVVERAYLTLFCFDLGGSLSIGARPVEADWWELDVSWIDRTDVFQWDNPGGDYTQEIVGSATPTESFTTIDIGLSNAVVKKWLLDPNENLGILLMPAAGAAEPGYAAFASSEESDIALRPMLTVFYSLP
jgi:hypothetical protein